MTKNILAALLVLFASPALFAQVSFISHVNHKEVFVNVGTQKTEQEVSLYSEDGRKLKTIVAEGVESPAYKLLSFNKLNPESNYSIKIANPNGETIHSLLFQTPASKAKEGTEYSFATGSCAYINDSTADRPGKPYGGGYEIFESIAAKSPSFMLWLGDNIYLRNNEWTSRDGIRKRYEHTRGIGEMRTLFPSCPQYAIWDDHDYGPNDQDSTYEFAELSRAEFKSQWGTEAYRSPEGMGHFSYPGIDFFLLDNRSHRAPNDLEDKSKAYFGKKQLRWLLNELEKSDANFKIIATGGQILNTDAVHENYANYHEEREWLIAEISKRNLKNVIFLTGDRHRSEVSKLKLENGFVIYDFTVSPLSSKTYPSQENNTLVIENSEIIVKNFGLITYKQSKDKASLMIAFHNKKGQLIKEYEVIQED